MYSGNSRLKRARRVNCPMKAHMAIQSPLPPKTGPGTTRLGKRLGCPSGISVGNPLMLIFSTSNIESVTSSTVAI